MQQTGHKKSKGTFKKYILKAHLWLGLFSGIIVLIVSLSGAFFVFNEDITAALRKETTFHGEKDIQHKKPIPIRELKDIVNAQLKSEIVKTDEVTIPIDPARSYQFGLIKVNEEGWNHFNTFIVFKNVYVNQYTGKVLAIYDVKNNPFFICMTLHRSLLLSNKIGGTIVGISTIIFVIMLITGIILWWPKNKKMRQQR
ncbi:MAG: PepSY-associated TM helix domain-containing protein, partial [Chryseobacterium culicis]